MFYFSQQTARVFKYPAANPTVQKEYKGLQDFCF